MDFTDPAFWVKAVAALTAFAVIFYILRSATRPRYALRIVVDSSGVRSQQGLARAHQREVIEFLEGEFAWQARVTIVGTRFPNGYMKIDFRGGKTNDATQQKIRNYLKSVL